IPIILNRLELLKNLRGINILNETNQTIDTYLANWENFILSQEYSSYLKPGDVIVLSEKDPDFTNIGVLSDGTIGFTDYSTNWWLSSNRDVRLKLPLKKTEQQSQYYTLNIGFLND